MGRIDVLSRGIDGDVTPRALTARSDLTAGLVTRRGKLTGRARNGGQGGVAAKGAVADEAVTAAILGNSDGAACAIRQPMGAQRTAHPFGNLDLVGTTGRFLSFDLAGVFTTAHLRE